MTTLTTHSDHLWTISVYLSKDARVTVPSMDGTTFVVSIIATIKFHSVLVDGAVLMVV